MSDQEKGTAPAIGQMMFKKYDEISDSIKTSAIPKFALFVKIIAITLAAIFVGSLALTALGTVSESKIFVVIGRFGLIFTGVIFFLMASPIGFVLAGRKYVTFIRSFAVYQLFITLVVWVTPMPVTAALLFGLSFASCFLAFVNVLESSPGFIRLITTIVFVGLLSATYFPSFRNKLDSRIVEINEPNLVKVSAGDLKKKVKFFLNGKPSKWYFITPEGSYELFDQPGYHDIYQTELQPVTPEIARKLIGNEKLLSPRCLSTAEHYVAQAAIATAVSPVQKEPVAEESILAKGIGKVAQHGAVKPATAEEMHQAGLPSERVARTPAVELVEITRSTSQEPKSQGGVYEIGR